MIDINQRISHYKQRPPKASYQGLDLSDSYIYPTLLDAQAAVSLGQSPAIVWRGQIPATRTDLPVEGFGVSYFCLDVIGRVIPEIFPVFSQMEGHELYVAVYVDPLDCTRVAIIGGFTSHDTRGKLQASNTLVSSRQ